MATFCGSKLQFFDKGEKRYVLFGEANKTICAEFVYHNTIKSFLRAGFPEAIFMSFGGSRFLFSKKKIILYFVTSR